jgi:pimeloyl-ACP methyl ester carboxylesterase
MRQETAVNGFRLAYERLGPGPGKPAVLMLHGWPGDRTDYRAVAPPVSAVADVVVPDLRGSESPTSTRPTRPGNTTPWRRRGA